MLRYTRSGLIFATQVAYITAMIFTCSALILLCINKGCMYHVCICKLTPFFTGKLLLSIYSFSLFFHLINKFKLQALYYIHCKGPANTGVLFQTSF